MVLLLRKAKRARVSFGGEDVTIPSSLIIDTELVRYKWVSIGGNYPEYEKLIPTEFNTFASFDTVEAIKAVNSLKALSDGKSYPIDLTIADGKIVMANPDDKGQAEITAETQGEVRIRLDGSYVADALKACGGMVELKLTDSKSPVLFTCNGYRLVVMPMLTTESRETATTEPEASQTETEAEKANAVVEAEAVVKETKPKRKSKVKEPVAVA